MSSTWQYIGDRQCEECGGSGRKSDGTTCPNCWGAGLLPVFKEPTLSRREAPYTERRRFPRYVTDLPVKFLNQEAEEFSGRCIVIAEGGVAAILRKAIATGSMVTLQLPIPTLNPPVLETPVLVRNQVALRHGCEFVSLKDSEREAILQFCRGLTLER